MADSARLVMPGSGWDTVKRIIRAYAAADDQESPRVEDIASLAGVQRPIISLNNNFLRDTGFLREGENKLTVIGSRYAKGLEFSNEHLSTDALQELIRNHSALAYIANMIKARGEMKIDALRGEMIVLAGISDNSKTGTLRTIIDMLQDAKVFQLDGDVVSYRGNGSASRTAPKEDKPVEQVIDKSLSAQGRIVPIALGIGRLVNIELPKDWTNRDLPKLLKMLELSLSDGEP